MSTDLFDAIEAHDVKRALRLLADGADPNDPEEEPPGWRPLHAAVEELEHGGSSDILVLLIRYGADVNLWDAGHDVTPLLMACFREQREAVRVLLAAGADPNVVGGEGDSPLRCAVEQGDADLVRLLLGSHATASIDQPGGLIGTTALGLAARRLDAEIVRLLLEAGADPAAPDADLRKAVELLPLRDDESGARWDEVAALLRGKGPG